MKQIPNFFTLLNLIFGCTAIAFILQPGESIASFREGQVFGSVPEKITWGCLLIFGAAVVDFLDGFLARMLKAQSGMGEQLDSLSDMVSFGVAPSMVLWQLLRIGWAQSEGALDKSLVWILPAFLFAGAVAWRLAKFNLSTTQKFHFEGVPSPAAALVVASLPLIIWYDKSADWFGGFFSASTLIVQPIFLYGLLLVLSILMVSRQTFLAIKFTDYSLKNNGLKYVLIAAALILAVALGWLSVPLIFILYAIFSGFAKSQKEALVEDAPSKEIDITV